MSQIIIAVDQLINAVFRGWADETLSARAFRNSAQGKSKWKRIERNINLLFMDKDHCHQAFCNEQERRHMPPAYRSVYKP